MEKHEEELIAARQVVKQATDTVSSIIFIGSGNGSISVVCHGNKSDLVRSMLLCELSGGQPLLDIADIIKLLQEVQEKYLDLVTDGDFMAMAKQATAGGEIRDMISGEVVKIKG